MFKIYTKKETIDCEPILLNISTLLKETDIPGLFTTLPFYGNASFAEQYRPCLTPKNHVEWHWSY